MSTARALVTLACVVLIVPWTGAGSATGRTTAQSIAFTARGAQGNVFTVNPDGTGLRKVASNASGAVWAPKHSRLAFLRREPIDEDFRGDTIYRSDLYVVQPDGSGERLVTRGATSPIWSPNGRTLAFLRGDFDLWTTGVDGTGARQIVRKGVEDPTWSPDGQWIAFTWYAKDFVEVWLVHPDGSGLRRLVKGKSVEADSPAWAPDGRRVSFMGGFDDDRLFVVNVDGSRLHSITRASDTNEWSPEGGRVMFERGYLEREPNSLWVKELDAGKESRLALRTTDPDWSPKGHEIAFVRRNKIHVMKADGTGVRVITPGGPPAGGLDW